MRPLLSAFAALFIVATFPAHALDAVPITNGVYAIVGPLEQRNQIGRAHV